MNVSMAATDTSAESTPAPPSAERRSWPRRHGRVLLVALAALALVLLAAGAVASWEFSSEVVVPDHSALAADATVKALAPGQVTLSRSDDTLRPGVYGLEWRGGGHAVLEGIVGSDAHTVTRRVSAVRGRLTPGTRVALDHPEVYVGNPRQALGLAFADVAVPGELGSMPAWLIPARTDTWAIVVHGINGNREGDLYVAPALHRAGLPALLIAYRDDVGAPRSPDGHHHMGLTEWRDVQAAATYALAHGARRLVLVGMSMGGAIVAQFMERSSLAGRVAAIVLDAPALSWKAILSFNARELGLPGLAALPVEWMIDLRIDPDWGSLDALDHTDSFHLPILLFHGTEDHLVPISTSDAFARELRPWVTYYRVPRAGHVESWNVDPALFEARLGAFLAAKVR
jgi:hypothetical protein